MDRIILRRGSAVPGASDLNACEPGFRTAAKELYVGTDGGPVLIASAHAASGVFPAVRLIGAFMPGQVQIGTLFEGGDGGLYYKNKYGVTLTLAVPPGPEPEEE